MSYDTIEAAVLTQITAITGYSTANVKRGDWRHLGHGKALAIVLVPGPFRQRDGALTGMSDITWTVDVELYVLWTGEQDTTLSSLRAERQKILDRINQYPFLGATAGVMTAMVVTGGPVEPFQSPDGAMFWRQVLSLEVREANTFARAE